MQSFVTPHHRLQQHPLILPPTRRENNNNFGLLVVVEEVITSIARVVLRRNDVSHQLMIAGKAGIACHICIIMR